MGIAVWWDRWFSPPPPDPYRNRPAEFQHRCSLPAARLPGATWVCGACGCQWIVQKGYQVTADTIVAVDPGKPWLGSKTEAATYWHDKPYWSFDFGAYSRNRTVTGVEDRLSAHPQVVKCAVVWVSDARLGEVPRVFIEPVPNQDHADLERICYWLLREYLDVSVLNPQTIQYDPCRARQRAKSTRPRFVKSVLLISQARLPVRDGNKSSARTGRSHIRLQPGGTAGRQKRMTGGAQSARRSIAWAPAMRALWLGAQLLSGAGNRGWRSVWSGLGGQRSARRRRRPFSMRRRESAHRHGDWHQLRVICVRLRAGSCWVCNSRRLLLSRGSGGTRYRHRTPTIGSD